MNKGLSELVDQDLGEPIQIPDKVILNWCQGCGFIYYNNINDITINKLSSLSYENNNTIYASNYLIIKVAMREDGVTGYHGEYNNIDYYYYIYKVGNNSPATPCPATSCPATPCPATSRPATHCPPPPPCPDTPSSNAIIYGVLGVVLGGIIGCVITKMIT